MRVFLAAGSSPNQALTGSRIWHINLCLPLRDLGHEVIEFDFDLEPMYANADWHDEKQRRFSDAQRPTLDAALLHQVTRQHARQPIDVFLSYFYSTFVSPAVIEEIASLGIVTLNWFCNASYQFDLVSDLAPAFAFSLVPEAFRLDDYVRVGARPIYFQEAANPDFYHPVNAPRDLDVAFVGTCYGDRPRYLRCLVDNGIDVYVWGPGWESVCRDAGPLLSPRRLAHEAKRRLFPGARTAGFLPCGAWGGTLQDAEMVSVFSRTKISLGFSRVAPTEGSATPIHQVRLRDFEATMSGAFYLLEYFEEIEQFFTLDKEIVCFSNADELIEKVRFYLTHDAVREKIRAAGRARALSDHTWQKRFQQLFTSLDLA
jgi:hypothetical protein